MSAPHAFTSLGGKRANADGTHAVYCTVCSEFIANTFQPIRTATCELCQRVLEGKPLTNEAIQAYKMSKGVRSDVTLLVVTPEPPKVKGQRRFSLHTMVGGFMQALGFKDLESTPATSSPKAKPLARSKQRGRLFDKVVLGKGEDEKK